MSEVNLSFEKPFQNASSVEQLEMVAEVGGEKLEAMKQQVAELLRVLRRRAYEIDRQKSTLKGLLIFLAIKNRSKRWMSCGK